MQCGFAKTEGDFTPSEWTRAEWLNRRQGSCKECMEYGQEKKLGSGDCNAKLLRRKFANRMWLADDETRKCLTCMEKHRGMWACKGCGERKQVNEFSVWMAPRKSKRSRGVARCNVCVAEATAARTHTWVESTGVLRAAAGRLQASTQAASRAAKETDKLAFDTLQISPHA